MGNVRNVEVQLDSSICLAVSHVAMLCSLTLQ